MEKEAISTESIKPILFEADEFDVDSFNVRPLSKGLGFHQEREKVRSPKTKLHSTQTQNNLVRKTEVSVAPSHGSIKTSSPSELFWDQSVSQSELNQFYQQGSISESKNEQSESFSESGNTLQKATSTSRFLAWALDMLFLTVICLVLAFSFIVLAGMKIDILLKGHYLGHLELMVFGFGLFSLLYIFYFTILDMAACPGKSLLGLKVCGANGERPKASQTLTRSVVSLLSLFLLGLPAILDFQSRLSESVVSKDNEDAK